MRSVLARICLCAASLAICLQLCAAPPKTQERPKGDPFFESSIGISFPAKIGLFAKDSVVLFPEPLPCSLIRYFSEDGSCADISVYPLEGGAVPDAAKIKAHFESLSSAIAGLPAQDGSPVFAIALREKTPFKLGSIEGWSAKYEIEINGGACFDSSLIVLPFKGRILKIRISCIDGNEDGEANAEAFIKGFCEILSQKAPPSSAPSSPAGSR